MIVKTLREPPLPWRAEDDSMFHMARLLLIFAAAADVGTPGVTTERLTYYDFFSANPYLLFAHNSPQRAKLVACGFELVTVSDARSAQRFISRRERIRGNMAQLWARRLTHVDTADGRLVMEISPHGREAVEAMRSIYSTAVSVAGRLVLSELRGMSDSRLAGVTREVLQGAPVLIDLL